MKKYKIEIYAFHFILKDLILITFISAITQRNKKMKTRRRLMTSNDDASKVDWRLARLTFDYFSLLPHSHLLVAPFSFSKFSSRHSQFSCFSWGERHTRKKDYFFGCQKLHSTQGISSDYFDYHLPRLLFTTTTNWSEP